MFLSIKNQNLESIQFSEPNKGEDEQLYCDVLNNKEPLYIQTPKMKYNVLSNSVQLLFDSDNLSDFYSLIKNMESKMCEKLQHVSNTWFSQQISKELIEKDLWKSCINIPTKLKDPLSITVKIPYTAEGEEDFEVYNTSKKKLGLSFLKKNENSVEGTFLIVAKEMTINSTRVDIEWELVQVLVHTKKKKLKGFGIREEKNECKVNLLN